MTNEICDDNRFEIIEAAKQELIRCTNIEMCPDEMSVIDSVLFRLWQMGWLPGQERIGKDVGKGDFFKCSECECKLRLIDGFEHTLTIQGFPYVPEYCPNCGIKIE